MLEKIQALCFILIFIACFAGVSMLVWAFSVPIFIIYLCLVVFYAIKQLFFTTKN